jgi:septal ring factor EnvC (AmiA/AmiB activator)
VDAQTHVAFDTLRQRVDQRLDQVDQRFEQVDRRFEQVDRRFDQVDTTAAETRRHFDIVAEGLRADVWLLAEGFVLRVDRLEATLQEEIGRSHDTLAALIRLTYMDLDRRVTALEQRPRDPD